MLPQFLALVILQQRRATTSQTLLIAFQRVMAPWRVAPYGSTHKLQVQTLVLMMTCVSAKNQVIQQFIKLFGYFDISQIILDLLVLFANGWLAETEKKMQPLSNVCTMFVYCLSNIYHSTGSHSPVPVQPCQDSVQFLSNLSRLCSLVVESTCSPKD